MYHFYRLLCATGTNKEAGCTAAAATTRMYPLYPSHFRQIEQTCVGYCHSVWHDAACVVVFCHSLITNMLLKSPNALVWMNHLER
jgi:hypothetical protein